MRRVRRTNGYQKLQLVQCQQSAANIETRLIAEIQVQNTETLSTVFEFQLSLHFKLARANSKSLVRKVLLGNTLKKRGATKARNESANAYRR